MASENYNFISINFKKYGEVELFGPVIMQLLALDSSRKDMYANTIVITYYRNASTRKRIERAFKNFSEEDLKKINIQIENDSKSIRKTMQKFDDIDDQESTQLDSLKSGDVVRLFIPLSMVDTGKRYLMFNAGI